MNVHELKEMLDRLDPELQVAVAPEMIVPKGDSDGYISVPNFDRMFPVVDVTMGGKVGMFATGEHKAIIVFEFKPRTSGYGEPLQDEPPPS